MLVVLDARYILIPISYAMHLTQTVRRIQYQAAKLEVIELLYLHEKNQQPSLDVEVAHNIISTLRQQLFTASEACFDVPLDATQSCVHSLQSTVVSATNFLVKMSSGLTSTETHVVFWKEVFTSIISELVALNAELNNVKLQPFQIAATISSDFDSNLSKVNQQLKNLVSKCMGDSEKAERLIQYEFQECPELSREEAIQAAIISWEDDNR